MAKKLINLFMYAFIIALLAALLLLPIFGIIAVPIIVILLFWLYLRFNVFLPLAITLALNVLVWLLGADSFGVLASITIFAGFVGMAAVYKLTKNYLVGICGVGLALLTAIVAVFACFSFTFRTSPQELVHGYVSISEKNPVISLAARANYEKTKDDKLLSPRLNKGDEGYEAASIKQYALYMREQSDEYLYWFISGFAMLCGAACYLGGLAVKRRRRSVTDSVSAFEPKVVAPQEFFSDMRLTRSYLWVVFLPVLAFSLLGLVQIMRPVTRAIFNVMVIMPCALNALALMLHTCLRFKGKAVPCAKAALIIIVCLSLVFFEAGTFILALIGIADVILNVRKMLDYALS